MKTFSQVREDFAEFFKGAKDISGGIAKLTPYITALTTGVAAGGAPLTIATIVVLAATALEGCSSIIAVLAEPRKAYRKLNKLDAAERFDLIYHMLCQESYAEAVRETFSKMDAVVYSTILDQKAIRERSIEETYKKLGQVGTMTWISRDLPSLFSRRTLNASAYCLYRRALEKNIAKK